MARNHVWCFEKKPYIKKGTWTPEEDLRLKTYVLRYGIWNWNEMPKYAGLLRTGKSCRLRWVNYLRPGIKRGNFTKEEEETILKLHKIMGNRWAAMAQMMPGRTDNEIKNYFNTRLKKRAENEAKLENNSSLVYYSSSPGSQYAPAQEFSPGEIQNEFASVHEIFSSNDITKEENIEDLTDLCWELQGLWDQPPVLDEVLASKCGNLIHETTFNQVP